MLVIAFDFALLCRVRTSPLKGLWWEEEISELIEDKNWWQDTSALVNTCTGKCLIVFLEEISMTSIMLDDSSHTLSWWEEEISELSSVARLRRKVCNVRTCYPLVHCQISRLASSKRRNMNPHVNDTRSLRDREKISPIEVIPQSSWRVHR